MNDIAPADAVHLDLTSARPWPSARIRSIDTTAAAVAATGVIAVLTAADLDLDPFPSPIPAQRPVGC